MNIYIQRIEINTYSREGNIKENIIADGIVLSETKKPHSLIMSMLAVAEDIVKYLRLFKERHDLVQMIFPLLELVLKLFS